MSVVNGSVLDSATLEWRARAPEPRAGLAGRTQWPGDSPCITERREPRPYGS